MTMMTILVDDRMTVVEFTGAVLYLAGEFAGNLDFSIKSSGKLPAKGVLKNLRLRVPGQKRLLEMAGYGENSRGMDVSVCTELMPPGEDIPASMAPDNVEVFWLEQSNDEPVGILPVRIEARDGRT